MLRTLRNVSLSDIKCTRDKFGAGNNLYTYCFTLLEQSPDSATSCHADWQTIKVLQQPDSTVSFHTYIHTYIYLTTKGRLASDMLQ